MMLSRSLFLVLLLFQGPYAALSHPTGEYNDEHLGIQLSRHFKQNTKNGTARIVEHDKARIAAMKGRHYAGRSDEHVAGRGTNSFGSPNDGIYYLASVGVGSPATYYNLIVDTGSANTWVGADKAYKKTSTSKKASNSFSVKYGTGTVEGTTYTDEVRLTSGLIVPNQEIGVASTSSGFDGVDGILGLGPAKLTVGTLSPATGSSVPTFVDNLASTKKIPQSLVGVYFQPTTTSYAANGHIIMGAVDTSRFQAPITYVPITTVAPSKDYWGYKQSVRYGATTSILSTTSGILDTGTTLIYLSTPAFQKYKSIVNGTIDPGSGLLKIDPSKVAKLQSLFFNIGGRNFEFTANAQIWPRSLNEFIGGQTGDTYSVIGDIGDVINSGLDFIMGYAFLERFYSVYDGTNHRVGLATTSYTYATTN